MRSGGRGRTSGNQREIKGAPDTNYGDSLLNTPNSWTMVAVGGVAAVWAVSRLSPKCGNRSTTRSAAFGIGRNGDDATCRLSRP
jgi:hypothetical protein